MQKDEQLLTYYQVMIFLYRLDQIRKSDPNFNDEIISEFEDYVIQKTTEISDISPLKIRFKPDLGKYPIANDLFDYLCKITDINPLDKNTYNYYIPYIKEKEKYILENADSLLNKTK